MDVRREEPTGTEPPDSVAIARYDTTRAMLGVYGLYLAATAVLTWPVAARLGRYLPGVPGDPEVYLWNLWWLKFSIFELHQSPLWCRWILWPFGADFAFHTHTIVYGLVAIVLSGLGIGAVASLGLLFLNSFALTGLGTYLWCREFGAGRRGAFVGGFFVAFCHYRMGLGQTAYNLLTTECLPFFWLALKRGVESGRVRPFGIAAVLGVVIFWEEAQIFVFAVFFASIFLGATLVVDPRRFVRGGVWRGFGVALAIVLLGMLPYLASVVPLLLRGEYEAHAGGPLMGADLLSLFAPWPYHSLVGRWTRRLYDGFHYGYLDTAYLGYTALALAVIGFRAARVEKRRIWWMAVAAVFFLLLTFGERLEVAGEGAFRLFGKSYSVALPAVLIRDLPILRNFRAFSRFAILTVFALSVPVALGAGCLEQRVRGVRMRRLIIPALLLLITVEVVMWPFETHPRVMPQFAPVGLLERIRQDPETTTVFTVPPTIRTMDEQYMQVFHQKPIYGGELSRLPKHLVWHYEKLPGIGNFTWYLQQHLDERMAATELSAEFVDRFVELHNVKYLILGPASKRAVLHRLVESRFPIKTRWTEGHFILYELERPPPRPLHIDFSQAWSMLYLGRNFEPPSGLGCWAVAREADLALPIRGRFWKSLVIEMTPFVYDKSVRQRAKVFLNGCVLGTVTLEPQFTSYQFAIPREALDGRSCSTLAFRFGYCFSPKEKGISDDRRTLAVAILEVHVQSETRDDLPIVNR